MRIVEGALPVAGSELRRSYGWAAFVPRVACESLDAAFDFWRSAGSLFMCAFFCGLTDAHYENMIGCGRRLVLVDTETLFTPLAADSAPPETLLAYGERAWLVQQAPVPFNAYSSRWIAGMQHAAVVNTSGAPIAVQADRSPLISVVLGVGFDAPSPVLPFTIEPGGSAQYYRVGDNRQFRDSFVAGMLETRRALVQLAPDALDRLAGCVTSCLPRLLVRPTDIYARALLVLVQKASLTSVPAARARLAAALGTSAEAPAGSVEDAELRDLLQFDIPVFYVDNSRADIVVLDSRGLRMALSPDVEAKLQGYVPWPLVWRDRLHSCADLSEDAAEVVALVRHLAASVDDAAPAVHVEGSAMLPAACLFFCRELIAGYQTLDFVSERERMQWTDPSSLYSGVAGQAFFLAAVLLSGAAGSELPVVDARVGAAAAPDGDGHAAQLASASKSVGGIATAATVDDGGAIGDGLARVLRVLLRRHVRAMHRWAAACVMASASSTGISGHVPLGGFEGLGAVLYTCSVVAAALDDVAVVHDVLSTVSAGRHSVAAAIAADTNADVMAGTAGFLLGLDAAVRTLSDFSSRIPARGSEMAPGPTVFDEPCAHLSRLGLKRLRSLLEATPPAPHLMLASFAHGLSGIAYAVQRTALRLGDACAAAAEYMNGETVAWTPHKHNWRDLRWDDEQFPASWCHCAAGCALARLHLNAGVEHERAHAALAMLRDEMSSVARVAAPASDRSLCCGWAGIADSLLATSTQQVPAELADAIYHQLAVSWAHLPIVANSTVPLHMTAGHLMKGNLGLGYLAARLLAPQRVPCVLLMQPVKWDI